ncbi:hypothetical protein BDY19DRAFT_131712 [Irpex rosettiformis]|uniref:Uncharacterized protein n=1 Tax=Irpex rosettiformis TaxID=378272 RepID=A0ACB8U4P5_9APHY|nr:hypothetical protein BDY19DRAFT_131712 [Irpex rosettiformis]
MASRVFGFFTKKSQSNLNIETPTPTNVPLPSSPPPIETDLSASTTDMQQLRTPSPSIDSASIARGRTSPAPTTTNNTSYSASTRQISEAPILPTPIATDPPQPALLPTSESIAKLIKTVPPKTLHAYVLEQLPSVSADILESLCAFFNTMTPPPKLHCVRCHKDFTEVENDDRSCLVPHDDESAEVERVGRSSTTTTQATTYETLWGCCGKTSEGDGSQGPPEGWCYEGKHTTDAKRARFRADSTPQDDKLTSCMRLNCHGIRDRRPGRATSTRKRVQRVYKEAATDEEGSEGESDSGMEEITGKGKAKAGPARKKKPATQKGKARAGVKDKEKEGQGEDKMEVDGDSSKVAGSSEARSPAAVVATPTSAPPKRRGRPPKRKADEPPNEDGTESAGTVTPAPKRKGRTPKSKPLIEDSDVEPNVAGRSSPSPTRGGNRTPRPSSLSRGRQVGNVSRIAAEFNKKSDRPIPSKSRLGITTTTVGDEDVEMVDSLQPKKKRKIAS